MSAKVQTGLQFILAGDTNDLKLDSILDLNPRMQQMVQGITRLDPPRMLDPILTTLGSHYQSPEILRPLDADPDSDGRPSDHLIPVMRPVDEIENRCARTYRQIQIRPVTKSGLAHLRTWVEAQDWVENLKVESVSAKAALLLTQLRLAVQWFLPEKNYQGCK